MKKSIKDVLRCNRGGAYIDVVIMIMVFSLVLACVVQVIPGIIYKYQLGSFATNISRIISVEGCYTQEVRNSIEEYRESGKLGNVLITLEGTEFITGSDRIQLNDQIVVHVRAEYDLGFLISAALRLLFIIRL